MKCRNLLKVCGCAVGGAFLAVGVKISKADDLHHDATRTEATSIPHHPTNPKNCSNKPTRNQKQARKSNACHQTPHTARKCDDHAVA